MVIFASSSPELSRDSKPDLLSTGVITSSYGGGSCPKCGESPYFVRLVDGGYEKVEALEGPYFRYERRESELFLDMSTKYFRCSNCGEDVIVLDYQAMVGSI